MRKKESLAIYALFMLVYISLFAYNYTRQAQWMLDNALAMLFLTVMLFLNRWLKLGRTGFLMFNMALLIHNLGTFGFYAWTWSFLAYDNVVHFVSSIVTAYIAFNFIARKLHIRKNQRVKRTVVDEHRIIFIFLVIATVSMLGVLVELMEYAGFLYLGEGEGLFFVGAGDSGDEGLLTGQYTDTMNDIMVNTIGAILGVFIYYKWKYKKRPWLNR